MKSIFVDCNKQLEPVFVRVHRADDPPITVNTEPFQPSELPRLLAGYDICLDDHSDMPTEFIAQCKGLKHIVFLGTGASSYMDVPALNGLGVEVHTIKGYGDTAVAEHTVALMFACCRDLARMDRAVRAGTWEPLEGMQLTGKTLGVVGLGGIGSEVVRLARGIGMEVIAWNRTPRPDAGVPLVDLDDAAGAGRRGLAPARPQRRDARHHRRRAHRAHEAGRDPDQHRARRAGRRGGADRGARQRPHPARRARRVPRRAAHGRITRWRAWRT